MATKTTTRGFKHRCPCCGEENTLSITLENVHCLSCSSCDNTITAGEVQEIIGQWQVMLRWLDTAPEYKD